MRGSMTESALPSPSYRELKDYAGREVELLGWLDNKRSSGKIGVLQVRLDGRVVQAVASRADLPESAWADVERVTQESTIRDFFYERDFTLIDSPILTPAACEGTSTLFETDYFGDKAFLSQSGQLYLEPAAAALGKVYCFGPTFRAEKSKTRRHLM